MNKKGLISLFLLFILAFSTFLLFGCVNLDQNTNYVGTTVTFLSQSEAEISFVFKSNALKAPYDYENLYNKTAEYFEIDGGSHDYTYYPLDHDYVMVSLTVKSETWQLSGQKSATKRGGIASLFYADIGFVVNNPFTQPNSPFKNLFNELQSMGIWEISSQFCVKVPIDSKNNLTDADLNYINGRTYASWVQITDLPLPDTLGCTYTVMVSVGWFILAMILGTAIMLSILFLTKGSGKMIDNPATVTTRYYPHGHPQYYNPNYPYNPNNPSDPYNQQKQEVFPEYTNHKE